MSEEINSRAGAAGSSGETPLYEMVKQSISGRIHSGEWPPRHRIPSENELVLQLNVSRMTINRALRELAQEGLLLRVQGSGTFVSEGKVQSNFLEVRNIADEIAERGQKHSAQIIVFAEIAANPEIAENMKCPMGARVFHSIIVHSQNDIPVQLEERYVNPDLVPAYLEQDYTTTTPNHYLTKTIAWTSVEHEIEAMQPAVWEARLLFISRMDPCLCLRRRTFKGEAVVTTVRMVVPGGRYKLKSLQRAAASQAG